MPYLKTGHYSRRPALHRTYDGFVGNIQESLSRAFHSVTGGFSSLRRVLPSGILTEYEVAPKTDFFNDFSAQRASQGAFVASSKRAPVDFESKRVKVARREHASDVHRSERIQNYRPGLLKVAGFTMPSSKKPMRRQSRKPAVTAKLIKSITLRNQETKCLLNGISSTQLFDSTGAITAGQPAGSPVFWPPVATPTTTYYPNVVGAGTGSGSRIGIQYYGIDLRIKAQFEIPTTAGLGECLRVIIIRNGLNDTLVLGDILNNTGTANAHISMIRWDNAKSGMFSVLYDKCVPVNPNYSGQAYDMTLDVTLPIRSKLTVNNAGAPVFEANGLTKNGILVFVCTGGFTVGGRFSSMFRFKDA